MASGTAEELKDYIAGIYSTLLQLTDQDEKSSTEYSAVARKYQVKSFRQIVIHLLVSETLSTHLDTSAVLEDVIDFLLTALGAKDTQVRYASSKALSVVTLKLEPDLATEIVEALLGSLNENMLWNDSERDLSAVDSLRWHGLTLTLAHLLYRRSPSTTQIPEILSALLLALSFKQNTPAGSLTGTSVRDAACFGIWSLSRRYTTEELNSLDVGKVRLNAGKPHLNITQNMALELYTTACLDPIGNIRRGASAALQELIGRHPDTVIEGIALTQIVDFLAVGLRERSIVEVGVRAARFDHIYWDALFEGLLSWRGVGSLDIQSRSFTAAAIARLSSVQPFPVVQAMIKEMTNALHMLPPRAVETRHGLLIALAALIQEAIETSNASVRKDDTVTGQGRRERTADNLQQLSNTWKAVAIDFLFDETDFKVGKTRPELSAAAYSLLLGAYAKLTHALQEQSFNTPRFLTTRTLQLFTACLSRNEEAVTDVTPQAACSIALILPQQEREVLIDSWLSSLGHGNQTAGYVLALGACFGALSYDSSLQFRIVDALSTRCVSDGQIEARVTALRGLSMVISSVDACMCRDKVLPNVFSAVHCALNDYTINERGDIGSLLRLEGLAAMREVHKARVFDGSDEAQSLQAAIVRLAVEKLDKVRLKAAECLSVGSNSPISE